MNRVPLVTTVVLAMSVFATSSPAIGDALIYDRHAIGAGEVWRLFTGHLVHLSLEHLISDLLAFGISGAVIERGWGRLSSVLYLAMSTGIGVALWALEPALERFGGLSGLAYGNVAFLALAVYARHGQGQAIARMLLAALPLKLLADFAFAPSGVPGLSTGQAVTVPLSHLTGVLIACALFITATQENRHVSI